MILSPQWTVFGIILFFILHLLLQKVSARHIVTAAIYNIFGTLIHELTHFAVAFLLNGKPRSISIYPKYDSEGLWTLGSVKCSNVTWYNAIPIGLAPLSLFWAVYWLHKIPLMLFSEPWTNAIAHFVLMAIFATNALPSLVDLKVALHSLGGIIFYGVVAASILVNYDEILLLYVNLSEYWHHLSAFNKNNIL